MDGETSAGVFERVRPQRWYVNMKFCLLVVSAVFSIATAAATSMPMIVSHRGESKDAPENTMAVFRLAV